MEATLQALSFCSRHTTREWKSYDCASDVIHRSLIDLDSNLCLCIPGNAKKIKSMLYRLEAEKSKATFFYERVRRQSSRLCC